MEQFTRVDGRMVGDMESGLNIMENGSIEVNGLKVSKVSRRKVLVIFKLMTFIESKSNSLSFGLSILRSIWCKS